MLKSTRHAIYCYVIIKLENNMSMALKYLLPYIFLDPDNEKGIDIFLDPEVTEIERFMDQEFTEMEILT